MNWAPLLIKFRYIRRLMAENDRLRTELAKWAGFVEPGHFYSPLPSRAEVREVFARGGFGPPFSAVDLNEAAQFSLLEKLAGYYPDQPFPEEPVPGRRFHLNNSSYGHFDAIMLYGMIRHLQPRRIIEVGSGFSSAAMLDINEHVLQWRVQLTFIDPDMSRVRSLLRVGDDSRATLIERRVQDVPLDVFTRLEANDILFIDSSHVSKVGSDVNRLFFEVLPALGEGVHVHIHDVAGNLEYPKEWFDEGRAWNEQYLLRAFLMYNRAFQVVLFSAWLFDTKNEFLRKRMPLCARGGGGQIWLQKMAG
jgi:hypothetical protein